MLIVITFAERRSVGRQYDSRRMAICPWKEEKTMLITDTGSFGAAIRGRRKELAYTQAYISQISGFSVSFLSDLETRGAYKNDGGAS